MGRGEQTVGNDAGALVDVGEPAAHLAQMSSLSMLNTCTRAEDICKSCASVFNDDISGASGAPMFCVTKKPGLIRDCLRIAHILDFRYRI
jgi:hypothetical protein